MSFRSARPMGRLLGGIGAASAMLVLASGWIAAVRPGRPSLRASGWSPGVPRAIAVHAGRAVFRVPTPDPTSETLVVVSVLARGPGPYSLQLTARPIRSATAPELADDGPRTGPALRLPSVRRPPDDAPVHPLPPRERTFDWMVQEAGVTAPGQDVPIRGLLQGVGRRVQVYLASEDADRIDKALVPDLIATFDHRIHPLAEQRFGAAHDVDQDGRFTILLSSRLKHLGDGRHAVDGFVRVADFDRSIPAPFGNRCDMMYLNSGLKPGPYARTLLAHEYMHAVTFTQKSLRWAQPGQLGPEEEGWLDEAIAHLAEDLQGFSTSNIDYRISAFLSAPQRYQLVVEDYYAADLFRSHGHRGSTYLFLRWCVDQYGLDLLPTLVRSNLRGIANLEAATGATFANLFRRWSLALYRDGIEPDRARPAGAIDGFRSMSLRGPCGAWDLARPRYQRIVPGGPAHRWKAAGTTSDFAVVDGSVEGAVEIEVQGPAAARIQVTALPLGARRARLELVLRPSFGTLGEPTVRAHIAERHGVPVHLTALSWEFLAPGPHPDALGWPSGQLGTLGVIPAFDTAAVPPGGALVSRPIPLAGVSPRTGPIVLKVVGTDPLGRSVSAWADLNPEPAARPSKPMRGRSAPE